MLCPGFIYALDMPKLCERNEIYQVEGLTGERGKERAEKRERERVHYVDEPLTFRPLEIFKYRKRFFSPLVSSSPFFLLLFLCPLYPPFFTTFLLLIHFAIFY